MIQFLYSKIPIYFFLQCIIKMANHKLLTLREIQ